MIEHFFPTTIYYSDKNLINNLDFIKQTCLEIIDKVDSPEHPFGESSLTTTYWDKVYGHLNELPEFNPLTSTIIEQSLLFLKDLGFPSITKNRIRILNMWVNLITKYDYHAQHTHNVTGECFLSGIYYVSCPKGAMLDFSSPYRHSYMPITCDVPNGTSYTKISYDCIPGRIIMFKSNVFHGYDSHRQDEDKISIPFNLQVLK